VVVADSEVDCGKGIVAALTAWGMHPVLVHDGVEAMLTIQRMLPRIVILDAALPKMYGFQVCEVIKRNESLRGTHVILVGAIHNQERYHRPPTDLYGADCYLERPDLPTALGPAIEGFGIELLKTPGAPAPPAPAATPAPEPVLEASSRGLHPSNAEGLDGSLADEFGGFEGPVPDSPAPVAVSPDTAAPDIAVPEIPALEAPAPAAEVSDELADARGEAERLARIIVSDVILYQPDKFAEGLRTGKLVEALDAGIEEGRTLFRQRIDERVRDEKDYLIEELMRVARERGMQ
jgi:CheY-like chemotaxis protein